MIRTFFIILFLFLSTCVKSQNATIISFKIQAYPTGLIPGVQLEKSINEQSTFLFRLGYNWFRHRDLGVHDDERGDGFGFTLGYRRYLKEGFQGWSIAVKNDFWWNHVDWYDLQSQGNRIDGETDITVLQPTIAVGYTIAGDGSVTVTPSLAFGFEWNVRTAGAPTGEGAIILAGIAIGKKI